MKTEDLRKLIRTQLITACPRAYYRQADKSAVYPYIVFELNRVNMSESTYDTVDLQCDVYSHADDSREVDKICDTVEGSFNAINIPSTTLLPTFFRDSRYPVDEQDKAIQHIQMHFSINLYERT